MRTKTSRWIAMTGAIVLAAGILSSLPASADIDVSFGFFHSSLSPHGSWLVSAEYGRVWQPRVHVRGWHPYLDGHWVYTDLGWTWASDYAWGAIPYHYGTWVLDPRLGWVWVPGTTWAPSWVVFSEGPGYIGWAPVPPRFSLGVSVGFGDVQPDCFLVVPSRYFVARHLRGHVVPRAATRTILHRTKIVNDFRVENRVIVNRGIAVRRVERYAGVKVKARRIETVPRVAPARRFTRADLRADLRAAPGHERRFRAAEPYPADRPVPHAGRRGERRGERAGGRDRDGSGHRDRKGDRASGRDKKRDDGRDPRNGRNR